jgi:hypothetical protein
MQAYSGGGLIDIPVELEPWSSTSPLEYGCWTSTGSMENLAIRPTNNVEDKTDM